MKKSKKLLCIILVFIMLFESSSGSFAILDDIDKGIWDKGWEIKISGRINDQHIFINLNRFNTMGMAVEHNISSGFRKSTISLHHAGRRERVEFVSTVNSDDEDLNLFPEFPDLFDILQRRKRRNSGSDLISDPVFIFRNIEQSDLSYG